VRSAAPPVLTCQLTSIGAGMVSLRDDVIQEEVMMVVIALNLNHIPSNGIVYLASAHSVDCLAA
jgi:hypothetical protein